MAVLRRPQRPGRQAPCRLLLAWLAALMIWAPAARCADIRILVADDAPYYLDAATSLRQRLSELDPGTQVKIDAGAGGPWPPEDLLVTLGSRAMERLRAQYPERVALHLFVTNDAWQRQQARDPGLTDHPAVAIDAPPRHQIALVRALLPEARSLAIVLGPISRKHLELVQREATAAGFEPLIGVLGPDDNPLTTLAPLIDAADAALVLPDHADFNSAVAKWLLQVGFRERTPVIAFSQAYVTAGALASIFASPQDIGRTGAELLDRWRRTGEYPRGLSYPGHHSIVTNAAVAEALGVELPDAAQLERRVAAALEAIP